MASPSVASPPSKWQPVKKSMMASSAVKRERDMMVRAHGERNSKRHLSKEREVLEKLNQLQLQQTPLSPPSRDVCSTPPPKVPFSAVGHSSSVVRASIPTPKNILIHLPPPPPPSKREERRKKKRPAILPQHRRKELLQGRQQAAAQASGQSPMSVGKENMPPISPNSYGNGEVIWKKKKTTGLPPTSPYFYVPVMPQPTSNSTAPTPHPTPISQPVHQPITSPAGTPLSFPTSHLAPTTPATPLSTVPPPPTPLQGGPAIPSTPVFYAFDTTHLTGEALSTPLALPSAPRPTPMSAHTEPSSSPLATKIDFKSSTDVIPASPSMTLCSPLREMGISTDDCGFPQALKFELPKGKSSSSSSSVLSPGDEDVVDGVDSELEKSPFPTSPA